MEMIFYERTKATCFDTEHDKAPGKIYSREFFCEKIVIYFINYSAVKGVKFLKIANFTPLACK